MKKIKWILKSISIIIFFALSIYLFYLSKKYEQRGQNFQKLETGESMMEVLNLLGDPDVVYEKESNQPEWQYIMDMTPFVPHLGVIYFENNKVDTFFITD